MNEENLLYLNKINKKINELEEKIEIIEQETKKDIKNLRVVKGTCHKAGTLFDISGRGVAKKIGIGGINNVNEVKLTIDDNSVIINVGELWEHEYPSRKNFFLENIKFNSKLKAEAIKFGNSYIEGYVLYELK